MNSISPGMLALPHITLLEAGLPAAGQVDTRRTRLPAASFYAINGKGYVQCSNSTMAGSYRRTDDVQYLADLKPELRLAPAAGSFERYRLRMA